MIVKVLGTGCTKCKNLEIATIQALSDLNIQTEVVKISDIQEIIAYGIISTPGLVINEKVVVSGRVPSISELREIISKHN